ncbi:hypothetical protein AGDE_03594 [Angomonas deanei]|nr:hypothetical protein AGDE_03594 [Angomonas deanei]|eukprot:EPY40334.1 hypothetical protein AGDE_03594 [Angomonas deanei]
MSISPHAKAAAWTAKWLTQELKTFAKAGNWEGALSTFRQLEQATVVNRNVFHYTTVISACCRAGQLKAATQLLQEMKSNNVKPNVYTYTALINGCAKEENVDRALRIFAEMRLADVPPNVRTMTALITVCSRAGRWEKSFQVLKQCDEMLIAPNVLTYTAAMDGCRRAGVCKPAVELLEKEMRSPLKVRPNHVTYNTVLGACAAAKDMDALLRVYAQMVSDGYQPVAYTKEVLTTAFQGTDLEGEADSLPVRHKLTRAELYQPDCDPVTAMRATATD